VKHSLPLKNVRGQSFANADDTYGEKFLKLSVEKRIPFSADDANDAHISERHVTFTYHGVDFSIPHPGKFSLMNALASIKTAEAFGVPLETCAQALAKLARIAGRAERVDAGQDFLAIVDYAHTPDSLKALYSAYDKRRKICVLGNTRRSRHVEAPEMGKIADETCDEVILTNEDPYDEDPHTIVAAMV
jgi:UDP-N-acetylmuramoyl-L-alanyl-D-glutamate--2,6-diaminopimelate ligase